MTEENKKYEIGFLIKSDLGREELRKTLKDNQFSVIGDGQISRIKLVYPIKKENFAYFGYLYFSGDPKNIEKLNAKLKSDSKILRFSIISQPIIKESESKIPSQISLTEAEHFPERRRTRAVSLPPTSSQPPKKIPRAETLSNEALEKKLEEILK